MSDSPFMVSDVAIGLRIIRDDFLPPRTITVSSDLWHLMERLYPREPGQLPAKPDPDDQLADLLKLLVKLMARRQS